MSYKELKILKRYVSIDIIRGIAILGMIFFHLLEDVYNMSWINTQSGLSNAPIIAILMLSIGLYLGAWAGLFLMVSAIGNMLSMYNSLEKGTSVKKVVVKQVVGGFILLVFGFLAEGTLQYYAVFQTIIYPPVDFSRILWKGYTMETIHTIAWCMMINGITQGILSVNHGYLKIRRNIIIYSVLAILILLLTQPIWDWVKTLIPGYPFASYNYPQFNRNIAKPSIGATFDEYILKALLMAIAGVPEPIFPFLSVSYLGSIFGLALCSKPISRDIPKRSVLVGLSIFIAGFLVWVMADMPFDSLFPIDNFSTFSAIGGGLNWRWIPWVCFITAGQVVFIALVFRLIEFRGKAEKAAKKTRWLRLFGIVPFTLYTFHRIFAMIPLYLLTLLFQKNMLIDSESLNGFASIAVVCLCIIFIYAIIKLWEKKDFIGTLEWMISTIAIFLLGIPRKSQEKHPWYRYGAREHTIMLDNVEWINIFEENDNGGIQYRNSKLALKFAVLGVILFPFTLLSFGIQTSAEKIEGKNPYLKRANRFGKLAAVMNVLFIIIFTILTMGMLNLTDLL